MLLLAAARRAAAGLRRLCRPRARDAAPQYAALSRRQGAARILRPRAVQRHRGPRDGRRACRACRSTRPASQVYFGIAGSNMLDDQRDIAFLKPERERFLEYDLTKLVYESLRNPKLPVVGVMSSLPLDGDPRMMMMSARPGRRAALGVDDGAAAQLRREDRAARRAGDRRPTMQVLLVAQAQHLSDADALRHRPVRHARRPPDGDGRSVQRGRGGDTGPAGPAADRHQQRPAEALRCLGHRIRPEPGRGRPLAAPGACARAMATATRRSITSPGSTSATASRRTIPRRPISRR